MMRRSFTGALWVLATTVTMYGSADAQSVSGRFTLDGKPFEPTSVAAFRVRDRSAPRTTETYVMLTTKPVDREDIRMSLDPYVEAINDEAVMEADFLAFYIGADGKTGLNAHVGGTQYLDSTGSIMGQPGALVAVCPENTATRVACTVKSDHPVETMDGPTWTLDVTFDTDIAVRAPGTPLPAGGGPAGQALLDLVGAVTDGKDLAKILAFLTPDQARGYQEDWRSPAENLEAAVDILGTRLPKQPTVTGGERWAEDRAVLDVEGVAFGDSPMLYLVDMRLVDGRWVYGNSVPLGLLR